jgi:excisionase family DNA binding protein
MGETIEELIGRVVREAVRAAAVEEMRPAIAEAIKAATDAGQTGPFLYVAVKEAARLMSAHSATVRKLVAEGKLGRYSLEGQLRVKVSDIHAYLAREGQPSPTIDLDERAIALLAQSPRAR